MRLKQYLKKLLLFQGMDLRLGVKKNYKDLVFGLSKIISGEIMLDSLYGKTKYHPLYPFDKTIPENFKHDFAIAAIVKNEGLYLQEWIEFHRLVGCSKFYIYDNGSTDNTTQILDYYSQTGLVEWIDWPHMNPWLNTQQLAYCHAIYKSRGVVRWLAFIDADEFLYSPDFQLITSYLNDYKDLPAMIVYWEMFGTSGHQYRPEGLLIENYTKKLDITNSLNKYYPLCKSIVQPHHIKAVRNAHCFETNLWPKLGYDENRNLIERVSSIHPQKRIKLNHYYTKSLEDWNLRLNRSWDSKGYHIKSSYSPKIEKIKSVFKDISRFEIEDTNIQFLVSELKKCMKKI